MLVLPVVVKLSAVPVVYLKTLAMNLSHSQPRLSPGAGGCGGAQQARQSGPQVESAVEVILELSEIAVDVFGEIKGMICPCKERF